jgi:hypothetical protein
MLGALSSCNGPTPVASANSRDAHVREAFAVAHIAACATCGASVLMVEIALVQRAARGVYGSSRQGSDRVMEPFEDSDDFYANFYAGRGDLRSP